MTLAIAADLKTTLEAEFREALERLCVSEWHAGVLQEMRIQPLRTHRNRCTVAIVVHSSNGRHELIGKIYADDRADVFDMQSQLSKDGFGKGSACSVPTPFGWLPALRVLLEERIEGPLMSDVIRDGGPADWNRAAERCGEWLGRFHNSARPTDNRHTLVADLRHNREATTCLPTLHHKAELLLAQLEDAVPWAAALPDYAGHGSFIPNHVIVSGERVVVIRLDEHDAADASRDAATFLVGLQRRAIQLLASRHALDDAADAFVQAYTAAGPPGALANLPLYRALAYLSCARADLYSQAPETAEFLIDEAVRVMSHWQPVSS